ncbi:hypothetical protein IV102_37065 [bacterium]|nr:hypothetical protein [bacterium]
MKHFMLPPALVSLLNDLYHAQPLTAQARQAAHHQLEQWRRWYEVERGFWIDDQEREDLSQLGLQLDRLPGLLGSDRWQPLLSSLRQVDSLMEAVNQRRSRQPYSSLPAFHHLILACGAVIIGQGQWEVVPVRCQMLEQYLENLTTVFASLRGQLDEAARQALDSAFGLAHEGLVQATEAARRCDAPALQASLQQLQAVAELVEVLPRLHRQKHEELQQEFTRFNVPWIGYRLEHDLQAAREMHRRYWARGAKTRLQETLPVLDRFWQEHKGTFLLPLDQSDELLGRVDQALDGLNTAYQAVLSPEPGDAELITGLESAMVELSDAFDALEGRALRPDSITSPLARYVAECAQNLRCGLMADAELLLLVDHLSRLPAWTSIRQACLNYLESGDYGYLTEAALLAVDASHSLAIGTDNLDFLG